MAGENAVRENQPIPLSPEEWRILDPLFKGFSSLPIEKLDAPDAIQKLLFIRRNARLSDREAEVVTQALTAYSDRLPPNTQLKIAVDMELSGQTAAVLQLFSPSIPSSIPPQVNAVDDYIREFGGNHAIKRILIANNGMAALKGILSIRRWAMENFGDEHAVQIVVMATPEDIKANAAYIKKADLVKLAPKGPNKNNYANPHVIVNTALEVGADAVWGGWGHASEDDDVPTLIAASNAAGNKKIVHMGPQAGPMRALGGKIESAIIAQSLGIPTLPWSGSGLTIPVDADGRVGEIPPEILAKAIVSTPRQALEIADAIGFPVMIKSSADGGGRALRKTKEREQVDSSYKLARSEAKQPPKMFVMKQASERARHIEVQIIADHHGNVIALHERECSIQRRYQKLIEEAPAIGVPLEIRERMHRDAIRLAKAVGYEGMGTVELLYDPDTQTYCFLELNSRIQVEHPVTEAITGLNIPGLLTSISMGTRMDRIPEIRKYYGLDPNGKDPINFDRVKTPEPKGHAIAMRFTAENADIDAEFRATTGQVDELTIQSQPGVWGYSSLEASGSSVHELADAQVVHLFSHSNDPTKTPAENREQARRQALLATDDLRIRGKIVNIRPLIKTVMKEQAYIDNQISITMLDQMRANGFMAAKPPYDLAVLGAAIYKAHSQAIERRTEYLSKIAKGQLPKGELLDNRFKFDLIFDNKKHSVQVDRVTDDEYAVWLNGSKLSAPVITAGRDLQFTINGQTHRLSGQELSQGLRLEFDDDHVAFFPNAYDPANLRSENPGQLLRTVVQEGEQVEKGQVIAIIEVSKMEVEVLALEAGKVKSLPQQAGTILNAGDLIATFELEDPEVVREAEPYKDPFKLQMAAVIPFNRNRADRKFETAQQTLRQILAGYSPNDPEPDEKKGAKKGAKKKQDLSKNASFNEHLNSALEDFWKTLLDPNRPLLEFREVVDTLGKRLPDELKGKVEAFMEDYRRHEGEKGNDLPAAKMKRTVEEFMEQEAQASKNPYLLALEPLTDFLEGLASAALAGEHLPRFKEIAESIRPNLPKELNNKLKKIASNIDKSLALNPGKKIEFPVQEVRLAIAKLLENTLQSSRQSQQNALLLLTAWIKRYEMGIQGERIGALQQILTEYWEVERRFDRKTDALAMNALRAEKDQKAEKGKTAPKFIDSAEKILEISKSHHALDQKNILITRLLEGIEKHGLIKDLEGILYPVAALRDDRYQTVTHRIREALVRRGHEPYEERSAALQTVLNLIAEPSTKAEALHALVEESDAIYDVLVPYLWNGDSSIQQAALEAYIHRSYRAYSVQDYKYSRQYELASWTYGYQNLAKRLQTRTGYMTVSDSLNDLSLAWDAYFLETGNASLPTNAEDSLTIAIKSASGQSESEIKVFLSKHLKAREGQLNARIGRITFLIGVEKGAFPRYFTFKLDEKTRQYVLDEGLTDIDPPLAYQMELRRLGKFVLQPYRKGSPRVRVFYGEGLEGQRIARESPDDKRAQENVDRRFFVRGIVRQAQAQLVGDKTAVPEVERVFLEALDSLDLAIRDGSKKTNWNQIFLNILPEVNLPREVIEGVIRDLAARYEDRLKDVRVSEVEIRLTARDSTSQRNQDFRFFVSKRGEINLTIDAYRQELNGEGKTFLAPLAPKGNGLHKGEKIDTPYAEMNELQRRHFKALKANTTYVYDLPDLLVQRLKAAWEKYAEEMRPFGKVEIPENLAEFREYALKDGQLIPLSQNPGENTIGMVAWKVKMKTPEYPEGREIVLISNDITVENGSFSEEEDEVFAQATEMAIEEKIPRIYVAANSGARIGMAFEVIGSLQFDWVDEENPEAGLYYYLADEDYARLKSQVALKEPEARTVDGEKRWVLGTLIGGRGLNQENLRGSGRIASVTSRANESIVTLTYVMGNNVGIGSYVTRLGQLVIQKLGTAMLLTGYQSLNDVLRGLFYTDNEQVAGYGIMGPNGVSHQGVETDAAGFDAFLHRLSFVPAFQGGDLPIRPITDPVERKVEFIPTEEPYDPRHLIAGHTVVEEQMVGGVKKQVERRVRGMFDEGSFTEYLGDWAKTVVVGKARLGGIPFQVITIETRTVERKIPADPGNPLSQEQVSYQAGKVLTAEGSYKLSQTLLDANHEGNPLAIVLDGLRGFGGGTTEMAAPNAVLKYGSLIVDHNRKYGQPAFVYMPRYGELRGGAWVVVDPTINENDFMEMFADPESTGSVVEPEVAARLKILNDPAVMKDLFDRNAPAVDKLDGQIRDMESRIAQLLQEQALKGPSEAIQSEIASIEKALEKRKTAFSNIRFQVAAQIAFMHNTPVRMKAMGVISDIVSTEDSREYFYWWSLRKLKEVSIVKRMAKADPALSLSKAYKLLKQWIREGMKKLPDSGLEGNRQVAQWLDQNNRWIADKITDLEIMAIEREVRRQTGHSPLAAFSGMMQGLETVAGIPKEVIEELDRLKAKVQIALKGNTAQSQNAQTADMPPSMLASIAADAQPERFAPIRAGREDSKFLPMDRGEALTALGFKQIEGSTAFRLLPEGASALSHWKATATRLEQNGTFRIVMEGVEESDVEELLKTILSAVDGFALAKVFKALIQRIVFTDSSGKLIASLDAKQSGKKYALSQEAGAGRGLSSTTGSFRPFRQEGDSEHSASQTPESPKLTKPTPPSDPGSGEGNSSLTGLAGHNPIVSISRQPLLAGRSMYIGHTAEQALQAGRSNLIYMNPAKNMQAGALQVDGQHARVLHRDLQHTPERRNALMRKMPRKARAHRQSRVSQLANRRALTTRRASMRRSMRARSAMRFSSLARR